VAALNILLIDDASTSDLAGSLRDAGHQVCMGRDRATAIARARELNPDVVLLDLVVIDGVARALRLALPRLTPIIALTAVPDAQVDIANIDMLINKPVQPDLFAGLIEYMRRRRRLSLVSKVNKVAR
jgi:DNA-binding response OmpR family regulator